MLASSRSVANECLLVRTTIDNCQIFDGAASLQDPDQILNGFESWWTANGAKFFSADEEDAGFEEVDADDLKYEEMDAPGADDMEFVADVDPTEEENDAGPLTDEKAMLCLADRSKITKELQTFQDNAADAADTFEGEANTSMSDQKPIVPESPDKPASADEEAQKPPTFLHRAF